MPTNLKGALMLFSACLILFPLQPQARLIARDNAADSAYSGGFSSGLNGGQGFGAWVVSTGVDAFAFVSDSKANGFGGGSGINTNGDAWGLAASNGAVASAVRPLNSPLAVGHTLRLKFDYGFIDTGGIASAALQNASGDNLLVVSFTGGNSNMERTDSAGTSATGSLGFSSDGFFLEVNLTNATDYSATLINVESGVTDTFSGTLSAGGGDQAIAQIAFVNNNAGSGSTNDFNFNALEIDNNAAPIAEDDAADSAYSDGLDGADNGGTGFGTWTIVTAANSNTLIGDSNTNGFSSPVGINTAGVAWGLRASDGDSGEAIRPLAAALSIGDILRFDFDFGFVETGSSVGVIIENASGEGLFSITFTGGGTLEWTDASGTTAFSHLGFSDRGFAVEFSLTSASGYSAMVTNSKYGSSEILSGTLLSPAGGQVPAQVNFFNNNSAQANSSSAAWLYYFNALRVESSVIPVELSAFALE